MMTRHDLADLWRQAAEITRPVIFGAEDALRPVYSDGNSVLTEQIDVPAVGMVGTKYDGSLAIISVNGAGAKDRPSSPSSDTMYEAIRTLRGAKPGAPTVAAFDALNAAVIASMPHWGVTTQHTGKILHAAGKSLDDIAYLYLVPFRTRDDAGSTMNRAYLDAGYDDHLVRQLRAVASKVIIAIDRPSQRAAERYKLEAPATKVIYYTRQRDAHEQRKKTLAVISALFAGTAA